MNIWGDRMAQDIVARVRKFNRFYTNILGLLNTAILDSQYTLSELRLLLEIDRMERCTFARLISLLNIDKGLASRQIKRLASGGLVQKVPSPGDRRVEYLELTPAGKAELASMEARSNEQVARLVRHLPDAGQEQLAESMEHIMASLASGGAVRIRPYEHGDIDYVIDCHQELYHKDYGFNSSFRGYVEKPVRDFHSRRDPAWEQMWIAELDGQPVGAIAIVRAEEHIAQLRWFFVDPRARGRGLGSSLIGTALDFCRERNYHRVILWTADVLKVSRRMYAAHGFAPTETMDNTAWTGGVIHEEKWELALRS